MSSNNITRPSLIPKADLSSIFFSLASLGLIIIGLITLESLLKPLVISVLTWFIIDQLKETIQKIEIRGRHLSETSRMVLALVVFIATLVIITELLVVNLKSIAQTIPTYYEDFKASLQSTGMQLNDPQIMEYTQKIFDGINVGEIAESVVSSFTGVLTNLAVVAVYVIFFLLEDRVNKDKLEKLFPVKGIEYEKFHKTLNRIISSVNSYIWSKTVISLVTGAVSYGLLLLMGVEYAFLWSFLIFVFNFIPYIGPLISSLLPAIFAALQFSDILKFVYVFAAMEGVQIVIGNFIEPKIMGQGTNLGPIVVIVALAFWGMIWGITGMALAVPITALIVIVLSNFPSTQWLAILLSEKGEIE